MPDGTERPHRGAARTLNITLGAGMNDNDAEAADQSDSPVLLMRNLFDDHFHVVGRNGGGKTSPFIDPQVIELIRQKSRGVRVVDHSREPTPPPAEGS